MGSVRTSPSWTHPPVVDALWRVLQLVDRKLQAALLDTQMGFRAATQDTPGIATDKERAELFSGMIDVHSAVLRDAALEKCRTFSGASPNWNVTDGPRPGYQR